MPSEPIIDGDMRILVLTNMYPPHAYGGYEQSCQDVVERWRAAGHQVLVLTSTVRVPGVEQEPEPPHEVRRALRLYWDDHEILDPPLRARFQIERSNRRALDAAIDEFAPDVVSAWAMGAMSLGLLGVVIRRGLPVVPVVCDDWPYYAPHVDAWMRSFSARPRLARAVGRLTGLEVTLPPLDSAGTGCFVSQFLLDAVRERSVWSFPDATVVYSGIKTVEFPFVRGGDDVFRWRLLYVGRIDPRKGIDTVIRALARCPDQATLAVVGRGDDRHLGELRDLAASLGLEQRVRFLALPRTELAEVMHASDALVFPSVWDEPFGLVPLEAMSCGLPVVGTPVGGAAEFLFDGVNCLRFPPGDVDALLAALDRLADDSKLRMRLIEGGRVTAAELDVDRLAETLERWHRHCAARAASPRPEKRRLELSAGDAG
jgi:glycosyltransferase involved in cell wall biosynthesis